MQCRIRPFCSICLRAFRPTRQAAALSRKYAPATPPLNFSFQIPHIAACGVLKYPQAEFRDNRQHMVEHIGLYFFVNRPLGHFRKEIEFDGQSLLGRLQLAHHQHHLLVDSGKAAQVAFQISAKHAQIRLVQAVDPPFGGPDAVRGVVGFDPPLGLLDIVLDKVDGAVMDRTYPIKTKPGDAVKVVGGNLYKLSVTIGNASEDIDFVIEDWISNTVNVGDIFGGK